MRNFPLGVRGSQENISKSPQNISKIKAKLTFYILNTAEGVGQDGGNAQLKCMTGIEKH